VNQPDKQPKTRAFIPAKRSPWMLSAAQQFIRADLFVNNKVRVHDDHIQDVRALPPGSGLILASNHADETDPLVCLDMSRRYKKPLAVMCNREAFDELNGLAGLFLQRLGYFSIERGRRDTKAIDYAIDVIRRANEALVIFPEGEIYYLNDEVQPLHNGAVELGMQAVIANRQQKPDWNAYIIPMAIKYHYTEPLNKVLEHRITKMEKQLLLHRSSKPLPQRILAIQQLLVRREQTKHEIPAAEYTTQQLTGEIQAIQLAMLEQVEEKYPDLQITPRAMIDKAWQLGAELRDSAGKKKDDVRKDIEKLEKVAELCSWRPHYYLDDPSDDRLAEVVLKLEREIYKIRRPAQLGRREVHVTIAPPINLGSMATAYEEDPRSVRKELTTRLHEQIQALVDNLARKCVN
jgi:1-acyl-sn-glycerol-3-phosphate acyltransferase